MTRTIEYYKARIHLLEERDSVGNSKIISKLKRKVRAMERANSIGQE